MMAMTKVLAVASQKGGDGKTTLALHLALAGIARGHTVEVIDLDPQGSAAKVWAAAREDMAKAIATGGRDAAAFRARGPNVRAIDPRLLRTRLKLTTADLVVLDTPPRLDRIASQAIEAADFVLVPVQAMRFGMSAARSTVEMVLSLNKPGALVLNDCDPRVKEYEEALALLTDWLLPLAPMTIRHRVAYARSLDSGLAAWELDSRNRPAETEIFALFDYLMEQMK
jgi:chromosome partitioning protein